MWHEHLLDCSMVYPDSRSGIERDHIALRIDAQSNVSRS